jgi:hypothetical protein
MRSCLGGLAMSTETIVPPGVEKVKHFSWLSHSMPQEPLDPE